MTENSLFWSGTTTGDAGPYSNEQFKQVFQDIFNPAAEGSYLFGTGNGVDDVLEVKQTSPLSAAVDVAKGSAYVNGWYYNNSTDENLTFNPNVSGNTRIDSVILRIDYTSQTVRLAVLEGTPAASPVPPTLTKDASFYEVRLADVTLINTYSTISTGDIDNTVRTQSILSGTEVGGTGISSDVNPYTKGDLIAAESSSVLSQVNIGDFELPVGDTAQSNGLIGVDRRVHQIRETGTTTLSGTRALITLTNSNLVNPAGYITSVAANVFTLEAGEYEIEMFINAYYVTVTPVLLWLADTAAPTTPLAMTLDQQLAAANNVQPIILAMPKAQFTSDGVQTFGIYGQTDGSAADVGRNSAFAYDVTPWTTIVNLRRIQ